MRVLVFALVVCLIVCDVASAQFTNSPWPMFHHDSNHTGRSLYAGPGEINVKWSYTTGSFVQTSPVIASDGTIYVGSDDGILYAFYPNGTLKWNFTTNGVIRSSPAIASDGTIYFGASSNLAGANDKFFALYPNGTEKWNFTIDGDILSSPAIASDGTIYFGARNNRLYALYPNGTEKWNFTTNYYVDSSPAIGSDGTIYFGSGTKLYALYPNGTEKWNFSTVATVNEWSSPAISDDGTIYFGTSLGYFYALNPDGTEKWNISFSDILGTSASIVSTPAIASDGTIYIIVNNGTSEEIFLALYPNGTLKWNFSISTGGVNPDSSPAIDANGVIYFGSDNGNVYALNPDGTLRWIFSTGGNVISSPTIGSDGTIYVGSLDHKLYALTDLTPPRVIINSPQNTTYGTSTITINVSAYDPSGIDKVIAQIDRTTNIALTYSNGYYIGTVNLANGNHYIKIYANDTFGNVNSSEIVYFSVNTSTPSVIYVPDDYAKIKWAVDNATAGSTIYVRNGTYSEYNINVSKSLRIVGLNYPLLVSPVDRGKFYGFNVTADDVLIKGFKFGKFEGYSLWGDKYGWGYAVYVKSDNVTVENCKFTVYNDKGIDYSVYVSGSDVAVKNCSFDTRIGTAIKLMNAEKVNIYNNTFRKVANGVVVKSSVNVTVSENKFEDDWSAIYSDRNSKNVSTLNNYIKGKDCKAIEIHSANSTIKGNRLVNVRYGIEVTGGADGTLIEDNVIDGVLAGYTGGAVQGGAYGIRLYSAAEGAVENIRIINNIIRNSSYIGMWIEGENITMRNNVMVNNLFNFRYGAGDRYNDLDTSNKVNGEPIYYLYNESNFVVDCQDTGIIILVKCSNIIVRNVSVSNNFEGIVLSGCNNVTIENSTITKNFWGILSVWNSKNVRVENNEIFRNYEWGIRVEGGDESLSVIGNEIHENGNGILVKGFYGYYWTPFRNTYIAENRIYNNTLKELANWYNIGIKVALADNVTIANNEIHDNSNGIDLTTSDQGGLFSIKNNRVYNNDYGIYARDGGDCEIINNEFTNNNYGIKMDQWDCMIERNLFKQNEYGLYICDSTIEGRYNEIINNTIGLTTVLSTTNMSFNNITQNKKGVVVGGHAWHEGCVNLTFNNIINKEYNIVNEETFNISAINNWWGTTNESLIEEKILDYYDDNSTGIVFYKPYLDHYVVWGVKGDFNNNGRVDIGDVSYVAYIIIGKVKHDLRADFNNNGRVDIGDLAKIAYYLLGKVQEL